MTLSVTLLNSSIMSSWQNTESFAATELPPVPLIRAQRQRSLELLAAWDQDKLDSRLETNRWSPGEVFDHLIRFDDFLLRDIRELIERANRGEETLVRHDFSDLDVGLACIPKPFLSMLAVPFSITSTITPKPGMDVIAQSLPIRHPKFATPQRYREKEGLVTGLRQSLEAYTSLLSSPMLHFEQMSITHPLLGTNNLLQLPEFIATHESRHLSRMLDLQEKYHNHRF